MTIRFEIPPEIEDQVHAEEIDLNGKAREALLVELYREDHITPRFNSVGPSGLTFTRPTGC